MRACSLRLLCVALCLVLATSAYVHKSATATTTTEDSHATDNSTTTHDDTHDSHDSHGHHFSLAAEKSAFCLLVFMIVLWTLMFEWLEHKLDHHMPENFKPILKQAFSELTVLGFIGVVSLVVTEKYEGLGTHDEPKSIMNLLSELVFHDTEHLEHRFHEVHYEIFFVMMAFISMVALYLTTALIMRKHYVKFEACTRAMYNSGGNNKSWTYAKHFDPTRVLFISDTALSEHQVFRDRFVETCHVLQKRHTTPDDKNTRYFDFAKYRSEIIIDTIVRMLKLSTSDWVTIMLVLFFFALIFDLAHPAPTAVFLILMALGNFLHAVFWVRVCIQAKWELLPCRRSDLRVFVEGNKYDFGPIPLLDNDNGRKVPLYLNRSYDYREGWLEKVLFKVPANQHEQLLWGQNKHRVFMIGLLRMTSFLNVICIASMLSFGQDTIFLVPAVGVLCLFLYLGTVVAVVKGIAEYSLVTSVEKMKNTQLADDICNQNKLQRLKDVWDAMTTIECFLDKLEEKQASKHGHARALTQDEQEVAAKLKAKFESFVRLSKPTEENPDMILDYSGAEAIMRDTWGDLTEVDLDELPNFLKFMDMDHSGTISFEEYLHVTMQHYRNSSQSSKNRLHAIINRLYARFDKNGDGTLSLEELRTAFTDIADPSAFGLAELFAEMDTSGDGEVQKSEFLDYVLPVVNMETDKGGEPHH